MRILAIPTLVRVVLGFLIFASLTACSWAQKDAGSIVGSVKDPSGAVVANANVTVSDVEHGQTVSTTTNVDGEFVVSPLRVGRYTVSVQQSGFKKAVSVPVNLDVQQRVAVNIVLEVGKISESVLVSSTMPLLESQTSELGQVVDSQRVANLPLNGRNFAQLALLTARHRTQRTGCTRRAELRLQCRRSPFAAE